jgi:hypothetical protein
MTTIFALLIVSAAAIVASLILVLVHYLPPQSKTETLFSGTKGEPSPNQVGKKRLRAEMRDNLPNTTMAEEAAYS